MEKLKTLKKILKSNLTRLESKIQDPANSSDLLYYKPKLSELEVKFSELFQSIFDTCKSEELDDFVSENERIQDVFDKLNLIISRENKNDNKISQSPQNETINSQQKEKINVRLPEISVPQFSGGNPIEWLSFKDLFSACVIENETLSPAQKLQYLKGALKGDALRVVNALPVSNANFEIAWSLLEERFANKRELIFAIIRQFMTLSCVSDESSNQILGLIDATKECIRSLESLNIKVDNFADTLFVYIIQTKLDRITRSWWERELKGDEVGSLDKLLDFLQRQARTLQNSKIKEFKRGSNVRCTSLVAEKVQCLMCKNGDHSLFKCYKFQGISIEGRIDFVKHNKLCFNCLSPSHQVRNCKSSHKCNKCHKAHNTLLHFERNIGDPVNGSRLSIKATTFIPRENNSTDKNRENTSLEYSKSVNESATNVCSATSHFSREGKQQKECIDKEVLLCTAIIKVLNSNGEFESCRVLLDPGSQASFISEPCMSRLGLPRKRAKIQISCLGTSNSCSNGMSDIMFTPHFNSKPLFKASVYILNKIIGELPHFNLDQKYGDMFSDLTLADPTFFKTAPIDILLGVDISLPMLQGQKIYLGDGKPFAVRSELGWIISGSVPLSPDIPPSICVNNIQVDLESLVSNFWKLDSVPVATKLTESEQACEDFFVSTHTRDQSGKYVVRLPFHTPPSELGDSKQIAVKRFHTLERTLASKPDIYNQYRDFMKEYSDLGHMEKVPDNETSDFSYYLPHHCVLKPSSTTSKLRVVFDASAKTSSGLSLNDLLMTGPRIQSELFPILLRFRTLPIAICADVEKMFRQIKVHPADRDFQQIIWRDHPQQSLSTFKLTTVTYGMACSPYLSTRAMKQLALDERDNFPLASVSALRDFYVDDLLSGSNSVEDAKEFVNQMLQMMEKGGFRLRKWISNCPSVLDSVPEIALHPISQVKIDSDNSVKVLGIMWCPITDMFKFSAAIRNDIECTKRMILSEIAKIFDPLGWLAPSVVFAKIFLQELWQQNLNWDDPINESLRRKWEKFHSQLPVLENFQIPRYVLCSQCRDIQIHAFCDASEKAYCAVIYLRSTAPNCKISVSILTAKTRVAPIKNQSLPRLELCSALLLANLLESILSVIELPISSVHAWTDSRVTLAWICSESRRWLPFVANRIAKIQETIPDVKWNHVMGNQNPADCATRGLLPSELINCELWLKGPEWLQQPTLEFSESSNEPFSFDESHLREQKKNCIISLPLCKDLGLISKFSSWSKLTRVTAWCLRFIGNCSKTPSKRLTGVLTSEELDKATLLIIRIVQSESFSEELSCLQKGKPLTSKSKILSLNAFLDPKGIIRVGGRLRNANLSMDNKHPVILPKKHHVTTLIVKHYHITHLHAAPQLLLYAIRQKYWIPCGRDVVRQFVKKCVQCFRMSPVPNKQLLGDLPSNRVTPSKVFNTTGVDFAGPFLCRERSGRGRKLFKIYVAVFVCFSTKAVHLETVSDLTTKAFIAALKRFISRRGKPSQIFSDCGTNFIGANRELKRSLKALLSSTDDDGIPTFVASEGIKWSFNPPSSPHFGGLWEAAVKSMKFHLKRIVGDSSLTFEEFLTLVIQVEACLNSRPICPSSNDPSDLSALTPGHFLVGSPLTAIPEPNVTDSPISSLRRFELVQKLLQQFWKRWNFEYLSCLQQRPKWCSSHANINVGDLVLIKGDNVPSLKWKLGRVVQVHPGTDSKVRVVTLKTKGGELKRSITKVCKLPVD